MSDPAALQKKLGMRFKQEDLLRQALVHRSYLNENHGFPLPSNERLEFLGDSVMGLVIAEELYKRFPDLPEGELTRIRSVLVCQEALASLAQHLDLGSHLLLGVGEERSGGRQRERNLAGALEALVGAVFLDQGVAAARRLALRLLEGCLSKVAIEEAAVDYKSRLQELIQARHHQAPSYHIAAIKGPEHDPEFTAEVMLEGKLLGSGTGRSKQLAEKEAARQALSRLQDQS